MTDQSSELFAYDPTWPARFAEQRMRLSALLKPWLAGEIEHVGRKSTSRAHRQNICGTTPALGGGQDGRPLAPAKMLGA
jgi:hypothetical protein